ncbi:telomerase holoenzyme est3 subunit [Botryosphaeria dothidea]|uniref:Telomerase holoenzyme est3 subunit n=1 Tax=Botryosphaeria dothidea TaxID=55169 RepID=A0A8H4IVQ2_9PEZI|nr:telomerase holoenzyme est3 subunit [Botryosphaeria dothidea]
MDLDGPVDEQFQVPHFGSAPQSPTKPARRSANGATSVVEETILPAHSETIPREAQDAATRSNQKNAQDAPAPVRMSSGSKTQMTRSPAMESARIADMKTKVTAFTKPANGEMGQMEGVSDYKNDLSELSDNGSVHSGRARKRAKTAVSIHSNGELDSDPGFRANSDDESPSSHDTARRDTGHLANGTKHDNQEERPKGALIDDGGLRSSMRSRSSAASSPRQIPEGRSSLDRTTRFDQIQTSRAADEMRNLPTSQSALMRNTQTTAKGDIMRQFCQAYPEYTGDPKHFANLCGQLVRLQNKMFHPFLWDDYIIQSKTKYVEYLARCAGTGINPLPWDARYMEEVRRPRFTREVMNPVMLDNFFAETRGGHDLERSATPNVMAGIGDDDPFARGDDDSRPGSSKQAPARTEANPIPAETDYTFLSRRPTASCGSCNHHATATRVYNHPASTTVTTDAPDSRPVDHQARRRCTTAPAQTPRSKQTSDVVWTAFFVGCEEAPQAPAAGAARKLVEAGEGQEHVCAVEERLS